MNITINEVKDKKEKDLFIKFPWKIYHKYKNWVPPLIIERKDFLNPQKNPFFEHSDVQLYLAVDEQDNVLGRIAGIINYSHIETHKEKAGFWGLFECIDNQEAANALFKTVSDFLRSHKMEIMRGPMNMCVNDDIGLLIKGYEYPPVIMMPYNPPYYKKLVARYGFSKKMDLWAYYGEDKTGVIPERIERSLRIAQKRYNYKVRPIDLKRFDEELEKVHYIYTSAWEENWGAIPMTDKEFRHLAKDLKLILEPEFCLIAEVEDEVAGFSLALPDFNQVLKKLNGRLLPFGIFKLLWHKKKIDFLRIITMGVVKKFRNMGIDGCFYYETYKRGFAKGYRSAEMSWILENNTKMIRVLENLGYRVYKEYRVYDYTL